MVAIWSIELHASITTVPRPWFSNAAKADGLGLATPGKPCEYISEEFKTQIEIYTIYLGTYPGIHVCRRLDKVDMAEGAEGLEHT